MTIKKILVATDGSEQATRAAGYAVELAKGLGAEILALHVIASNRGVLPVVTPPRGTIVSGTATTPAGGPAIEFGSAEKGEESLRQTQRKGLDYVQQVVDTARSAGVKADSKCCIIGDPALRIVNFARENDIDLIVMGSRGMSTTKKILVGSVSDKVIRNALCPVMIIR